MTDRLALFIDGAAFHHTARALNTNIDYVRLRNFFAQQGTLIKAHYFTRLVEEPNGTIKLAPLTDFLGFNGYQVHTRFAQERPDAGPDGQPFFTGSMNIDITIAMIEACDYADHLYLFSGKTEYIPLLEYLNRRGKRITIVSSRIAKNISDELRRLADNFIELDTIKTKIERTSASGDV